MANRLLHIGVIGCGAQAQNHLSVVRELGDEIARVEVPSWVADNEHLTSLTHSLILDQCRKGMGYPVAIMEAHEQAVINGHDRELFRRMIEEALEDNRLPVYTSQKARSKHIRWL